MALDVTWMPGPTMDAKVLQLKQCELIDRMYDAFNEEKTFFRGDIEQLGPKSKQAKIEYDQSVAELVALLGDDAHCNCVDQDLWNKFSDFYKSMNGFRPRRHFSVADVKQWLASL